MQRDVLCGRFRISESWNRLPIITSPSVQSLTARSAVGRSRDGVLELAFSRLEVPDAVLNHPHQVLESANESLDCNNREYKGNDGQSEDSEASEEENKFQAVWG